MTKTTSSIVIGTTLLLAVGAVGGHLLGEPFMKLLHHDQVIHEQQQVSQNSSSPVSGNLLASLKPNGTEGATASIYKMSPSTGEILLESDANDFFAPTLSHDGSRVAVVGNDGEDIGRLFVADITQPDEAQSYVPPTPALWAGPASWSSDDSLIVYEALGAITNATDTAIENSYVVVLDPETREQQIVDFGVSPVFAPDDSIVYLKSDGIYRRRMMNGAPVDSVERLTFFDGYSATRNSQMALSPDGSLIIVTHPESALFLSYGVFGADGMIQLSVPTVRDILAAWPVFSPDGMHLVYVALNVTGDQATAGSLMRVDLSTGDTQTVTSLEGYADTNLAIHDWIE